MKRRPPATPAFAPRRQSCLGTWTSVPAHRPVFLELLLFEPGLLHIAEGIGLLRAALCLRVVLEDVLQVPKETVHGKQRLLKDRRLLLPSVGCQARRGGQRRLQLQDQAGGDEIENETIPAIGARDLREEKSMRHQQRQ